MIFILLNMINYFIIIIITIKFLFTLKRHFLKYNQYNNV